ncbi:hypothetical protein L596_008437 [Steinernema carpocapsae]|uniref:Uncharacterized protein n=1 Tax=Steinernema carpocapsae TaxID=34508 RepID=A0A4U5PCR9_STECR|nr:hypothetical protein L596_008437 [Steinernema carpocapsae]
MAEARVTQQSKFGHTIISDPSEFTNTVADGGIMQRRRMEEAVNWKWEKVLGWDNLRPVSTVERKCSDLQS